MQKKKKKKRDMPHPYSGLLFPGASPAAHGFQALFVSLGSEVGAKGQFDLRTEGFGDAEGQVGKSHLFVPVGTQTGAARCREPSQLVFHRK